MPLSPHLLPLLMVLLSILPAGCAGRGTAGNVSAAPTLEWSLTPEARTIFLHLKADELLRGESPQLAMPVLEQLVTAAPSPDIYLQLATLQWQSGNTGQARETVKSGMERFPDAPRLVMLLAKSYFSEKRVDDAILTFRDYLTTHPEEWEMHEDLAALLIDAKQYAQALDSLEAIPEAERTPRALLLLGKASGELGLTEKAVQALQSAIIADPDFIQARVELAYRYEQTKEYAEAEAIYAELLRHGQRSRQLLARIVELNLKLNNPDKAMEIASVSGPEDAEVRMDMIQQFLDQGFYDHGHQLLVPILNLDQVPARAWFQSALISFEGQENPAQALDALARIDENDPLFRQALLFRIHLAAMVEEYDEAMRLADLGTDVFPEQYRFYLLRSEVLEQTGKIDQALTELEQAADRWPTNTDILFPLGVLQDKAGLGDLALEQMETIIRLNPNHADALNYLGYSLADQNRDLDRALVLIQSALRQEPDNIYFRDSLAWALFRLGRLDEAWAEIVATVAAAPADPTIWEHYGDIALALNKRDAARKGYEESLKLKPDNAVVRKKLNQL